MSACGILNLNKPAGPTSRQVVNTVQRFVRPAKVGHAGTLDPMASGVLVVCVGAATRLIEHVQQMPKQYTGTFLLGRSSPTEDVEGEVTELDDPPVPTIRQICEATFALVGEIQQRPPAFSALKVDGRRAYKLARQGQQVELAPRPVTVYGIEVGAYDYPQLQLTIECGSGTYVRSLGRDLAESLGTAAVMSDLIRTAIGGFCIEQAVRPRDLDKQTWAEHLLPPLRAVEQLPRIDLTPAEAAEIRHGRPISRNPPAAETAQWAAVNTDGHLVALLTSRGPGLLGPLRNFPAPDA